MALVINQTVLNKANNKLLAGDVAGAWQALADAGDSYAKRAAAIFGQQDSLFAQLVEVQWSLHATPEQIAQNFDLVAKQHLTQYLELIDSSGEFRLPDTMQIETSYSKALNDHGLSQLCAVDSMFSLLDYQDTVGDISWATMLEMEPARIIFNSNVWAGESFSKVARMKRSVIRDQP